MQITPVAYIKNDFCEKFAVPRQSGMTNLVSRVAFCGKYSSEDAFRGLDGYEYVWLIWGFDKAEDLGKLTVRPPRLGGNERVGVFATRSPYRPNSLGLSSVKLLAVEKTENGTELVVSGADLVDGTPIFDVKPYLPFTDSHPNARGGFAEEKFGYALPVVYADGLKDKLPKDKIDGLTEALRLDPRPAYQNDGRVYGFGFCGKQIKFRVENGILTVIAIE